jgi:hypothetical protein
MQQHFEGQADCWIQEQGPYAIMCVDVSGAPYRQGTVIVPQSVLGMHPGINGERPAPTWTSPTDGKYRFTGYFQADDLYPTGVEVFVECGDKVLIDQVLRSFGETAQFNFVLEMHTGENVHFSVDRHGTYYNDSTMLKLAVLRLN